MADTKATALTAFTPVLTDIIYGVDDPGGTPVSGKVTLQALMDLYEANFAAPATAIASGTFADARISESSVVQHTAAFNITESQISDLGTYIEGITGEPIGDLSDVVITTPADNEVLAYDTTSGDWINQTAAEAGLAASSHSHEGTEVLSTGEVGGTKFLREDGDGTCSWQTIAGGGDALVANPLSQFAATTSAQLAGVISDETGSGALVFGTSPTLGGTPVLPATFTMGANTFNRNGAHNLTITTSALTSVTFPTSGTLVSTTSSDTLLNKTFISPVLGTPTSGTLTNCTGLPASGVGSGTFADARIAQTNVTQHQAALSLTESQISDLGTYLENLSEDTTPQLGGNLDVNGNSIVSVTNGDIVLAPNGTGAVGVAGTIRITEAADHAPTPAAGFGYLWVRSDTPNVLVFTDDAGTDHEFLLDTSGTTLAAKSDFVDADDFLIFDSAASDAPKILPGLEVARRTLDINAQTGTTYTLVLADAGKKVTMSNASANTLTIPTNASVAFPVGTIIGITMLGAGATTVDGDTGVTVNGVSGGGAAISAQYTGVTLTKLATDTWLMEGNHGTVA